MIFPDWFQTVPGFRFLDSDGDVCVYLGRCGYRHSAPKQLKLVDDNGDVHGSFVTQDVDFRSNKDVFAYSYKNEWHLFDVQTMIDEDPDWINKIQPAH